MNSGNSPFAFLYKIMHTYVRAWDDISKKVFSGVSIRGLKWKNKTKKLKGLLPPFPHAYHPLYCACSKINLPRDISFSFHYPEFSALLVPLIFSRKRGRYYHGDRRSWQSSRDNNIYSEESSSEENSLTKL